MCGSGTPVLGREADDAGVHELGAGGGDDRVDVPHGGRADGVAVHEYRLATRGLQRESRLLGERERVGGRQDRQQQICFHQRVGRDGCHAGCRCRALRGGLAAAVQQREHLDAVLDEPAPMPAPMFPAATMATTGFIIGSSSSDSLAPFSRPAM